MGVLPEKEDIRDLLDGRHDIVLYLAVMVTVTYLVFSLWMGESPLTEIDDSRAQSGKINDYQFGK